MHRIDADAHVSNLFDPGDPLVPRQPTQVDAAWLNAVQEELCNFIAKAGIGLSKGTNTQLEAALPVRAHGRVKLNATPGGTPSIEVGARNLASASLISGVPNRIRVTFSTALPGDNYSVLITENNLGGLVQPLMPAEQGRTTSTFDFVLYNTATSAIVDPATLASREYGVIVLRY